MQKPSKTIAIAGVTGIAISALSAVAALADASPLPIKNITLDSQKQLVIEFSTRGSAFPTVPHLLDLPGPNHRVVVELTGAAIEKGSLPTAEDLTTTFNKMLPAVKGLRYSNATTSDKPTARLVLDLPESVKAEPKVVKVDESSVTIDLGSDVTSATNVSTAAPSVDTAVATASADIPAAAAPADAAIASPAVAQADAPAATTNVSADESTAPVAGAIVQPQTEVTTTKPGEQTKDGWDWNKDAATSSTAIAGGMKAAKGQDVKAPIADTTDGVAPANAAPATTAAQPTSPELRPAIGSEPAAPEQPMSALTGMTPQPQAAAQAATAAQASAATAAESAANGVKQAVRLYNSAVRNHLSGKLPEAISDYKGAIAANPQLAEAYSNLGLIYNQQHNYKDALVQFRKALAINPKDAITYNGIGAALRAEKDLPGAIKNWQTAVSLDPHLATAHYNLGTAFELQKDFDRALESYQEAVKNDYRLGEAYYRMGVINQHNHRLDDATKQFKEALKVSNDSEYSEDARQRLTWLGKETASPAKH
jgi:tetratricopeptide (TPR) repeat protein